MKRLIGSTLVFASLSVFADEGSSSKKQTMPFEQGTELNSSQFVAAYNYPARVKTIDGWDMFTTASFLYWNVFQEGMELGHLSTGTGSDLHLNNTFEFSDEYKPGFKVGLGWNTTFDDWVVSADYTWFHHRLHKNQPSFKILNPVFAFSQLLSSSHKWTIDLDMVDIMLGRPCYQGTRFILTPSFGLKGVFLNQKYTVIGIVSFLDFNPRSAYGKTDSWAVGPSLELEGRFLLGEGFRLVGSVSGTAAFTRYNGIQYFAQTTQADFSNTNIRGLDENRIRAIGNAQAGFGWGMYLCNQKYHIDFSATYEFQVFWNQNMIFWFADSLNKTTSGFSPGNLYFQGLSLSGTFDF